MTYKNFKKLMNLSRFFEGGESPLAEKWVFLSGSLIFRWMGKIKKNKYFQNYWTKQSENALSSK